MEYVVKNIAKTIAAKNANRTASPKTSMEILKSQYSSSQGHAPSDHSWTSPPHGGHQSPPAASSKSSTEEAGPSVTPSVTNSVTPSVTSEPTLATANSCTTAEAAALRI
jgi:hypothetical protein